MGEPAVVIEGMGHAHPPHKLDNDFFASLDTGSDAEWVAQRTGILSRYSVLSPTQIRALRQEQTSIASLRASGDLPDITSLVRAPWDMALARQNSAIRARSDRARADLDLLLCGTSVPDYLIPANANVIGAYLGLGGLAMDAQTACSSFVSNLAVGAALLQAQSWQRVGIFNVERYSTTLDFSDRRSSVLFGDGAACTLLTRDVGAQGLEVVDVQLAGDASGYDAVSIPMGGFFSQNGARVQKFAVSKTCEMIQLLLARNQLSVKDIEYFIGHQANLRMLTSVCNKMDFHPEQHLYNVHTHGNQGGAGAPIVLSTHWDRFVSGSLILVVVVGSGLTWGGALLRRT